MKTQWVPWLLAVVLVGCQLISGGADLAVGEGVGASGAGASGGSSNGGGSAGGGGAVGGGPNGGGPSGGTGGVGGAPNSNICSGNAFAVKLFGGRGTQFAHDIAPVANGGCIVVGEMFEPFDEVTSDTNQFPAGFVLRVDDSGAVQWGIVLESTLVEVSSVERVVLVGDHPYVLAKSNIGGYVAELDIAGGSVLWEAALSSATNGVVVKGIAVDASEDLVRVGGQCVDMMTLSGTDFAGESTLGCTAPGDGFVVALTHGAGPGLDPRNTRRFFVESGPAAVNALAVRQGTVVVVGHARRGQLRSQAADGTAEEALSESPPILAVDDGFITALDGGDGSPLVTRRMFGQGHVKAVAVGIAFDGTNTRIAVGGSFAKEVTMEGNSQANDMSTATAVTAASPTPHGFAGIYDLGGVRRSGPVHLGEGNNVRVLIRAVHISDSDLTRVIVGGKFSGTLLSGVQSQVANQLETFVVTTATQGIVDLLHIRARNIGDDGGFGMKVSAEGELFVATRLDSTWDNGGCCEVVDGSPSALVVTTTIPPL